MMADVFGMGLQMVVSLAVQEILLAWGMEKELGELDKNLKMSQAFLFGAQSTQSTTQLVSFWLKDLQSITLDAQIVSEKIEYEILRKKIKTRKRDTINTFFSSSNPVSFRPVMAHKIRDVLSSFEKVYAKAKRYGINPIELINSPSDLKITRSKLPFMDDAKIVGRERDLSEMIKMLTDSRYKEASPIVTILGMGGQGKTTLAQLIYKNDTINSYFEALIWVCVSDDFNVERLLGEMWKSLTRSDPQVTNGEALVNKLKEKLRDKIYLLILDDVWNESEEKWDQMRNCLLQICGSKESKILVTARNEKVALVMRTPTYHLGVLSENESWELFEKYAFGEGGPERTPQLVNVGRRILRRCGGVPLVIKAIGGLLYSRNSEADWLSIERSDIWNSTDEGKRVLSVIELSYHNLPSLELKQCFSYCSIFPKDALILKDQLIQLWIAQGLLNSSKASGLQMEDLGDEYFNILLRCSLLQTAKKDEYGNVSHCKMHDVVHDVSSKVIHNYSHHIKDLHAESNKITESNKIEAMHVSVNSCDKVMWKSLQDVLPSRLRTLYLQVRGLDVYSDLFENLQCLSVLIIEDGELRELPSSIGKTKHLRFLDISKTGVTNLPKSITKLYHLQTLRLSNIHEVPEGLWNLNNLRVLLVSGLLPLFPRIRQLKNLQTLSHFRVDKSKGCRIEELENLDCLKGRLGIFGLENVGSYECAAKSNLSKKSKIQTLELSWNFKREDEDCDDYDVMEGLKPHINLKSLSVDYYLSPKLPSWMGNRNNEFYLRNLVKLELWYLYKCERLPTLGDLPFLEHLSITSFDKVKRIGREFYGFNGLKHKNVRIRSEITPFPALKTLKVIRMASLVEWSDAVGVISSRNSPVQVKAFPLLEHLEVGHLPELSICPNFGSLPRLRHLAMSNLRSWPSEFHQNYFPSLSYLKLKNCEKLALPICSPQVLPAFAPIDALYIDCNPKWWPKNLHHLSNLKELTLSYEGEHKLDIDCLPWPYPSTSNTTTNFVHLSSLRVAGNFNFPKVRSLPHQIQYLTTLKKLEIEGFQGLEFLPEWLGNLHCLQFLTLTDCYNLKRLPSGEVFRRLTYLHSLWIHHCYMLQMACKEGSGSERHKIAHIPNLWIE